MLVCTTLHAGNISKALACSGGTSNVALPTVQSALLILCGMVCRLASGDCDGGVVVWDVLSASQIARLEDVPAAKDVLRDYLARPSSSADRDRDSSRTPGDTDGITSLAWVMPESNVLAVVVAPALLLLWDVTCESGTQQPSLRLACHRQATA